MPTLSEMQAFAQESQEHGMVGIHAHMQVLEALEEAVGLMREALKMPPNTELREQAVEDFAPLLKKLGAK